MPEIRAVGARIECPLSGTKPAMLATLQTTAMLLQTSILARLSGSLCDAVTGESASQAILEELRRATALDCTLPAIHYVLEKIGLTYKKRHSVPANKTGPTLSGRAGTGGGGKRRSTRPG